MKARTCRLYNDLSWIWPLWGDPKQEYREWSETVISLMRKYGTCELRSLLNLACGGGKNVYTLKRYFKVTGLDLSENMLGHARELNPDAEFVQGDMRNFSLGRQFDAILIDDGVSYLTSEDDLLCTFENAFSHLRSGGVMVVSPDQTKESFQQNSSKTFRAEPAAKPDHLDITMIENSYDPDPSDTTSEATFVYLIREHGRLRIEHDFHVCGLFSLEVWREALNHAGFQVHEVPSTREPQGPPVFACVKP
jgi:SAM-dependent methyltransferase